MRIAVFEDEPLLADSIARHLLLSVGDAPVVRSFDRPRRLREDATDEMFDAATVDLSFGRHDLDRQMLSYEMETGVHVIDYLQAAQPSCRLIVISRFDTRFVEEVAVAVRQTWPAVRMLYKQAGDLHQRIERFVVDNVADDNSDVVRPLLTGIRPLAPEAIVQALRVTKAPSRIASVLLALAARPSPPSAAQLAGDLNVTERSALNYLSEIVESFLISGVWTPSAEPRIERLTRWASARRPILERVFRSSGLIP